MHVCECECVCLCVVVKIPSHFPAASPLCLYLSFRIHAHKMYSKSYVHRDMELCMYYIVDRAGWRGNDERILHILVRDECNATGGRQNFQHEKEIHITESKYTRKYKKLPSGFHCITHKLRICRLLICQIF